MWWAILAFILAVSLIVWVYRGPVAALGTGVLVSFLFPSWLVLPVAGVPVDLRIATALILLLGNVADSRRPIQWTFNVGDWAMFVLYFVHVASDSFQDGFNISFMIRAFGEWSIPYIAGRLAIQSINDWRWLTRVAVVIAMLLAGWAMIESISHSNPGNMAFGIRPVDRLIPDGIRYGFSRAEGPTRHPIWLAMILTLLLPWTVVAAVRGLKSDGPLWWTAAPLLNLGGILATISRGPAIAALVMIYLTALLTSQRFRKPLIAIGIVMMVLIIVGKSSVLSFLGNLEAVNLGGKTRSGRIVEFDGEKHTATAMSYRWLVFSAYRQAIRETGLLGYGTQRTSTFPVNVPFGPEARQTVQTFWSMDCEYLLILLRFGWLGLFAFTAVCLVSTWHIYTQGDCVLPDQRLMPMAICATLMATMLAFVVEWMPHDYGFMFLWLCGVANGPRLEKVEHPMHKARQHRSSTRSHHSRSRSESAVDPAPPQQPTEENAR